MADSKLILQTKITEIHDDLRGVSENSKTEASISVTSNISSTHCENDTEDDTKTYKFSDEDIPWKKRLQLFWSFKHPRDYYVKRKLFFWTPPDQSKYETKLVFKLDCLILSYVCISFFIRYLDASNISNAYVSGMKEDLNMHGTDYNWLKQGFSISYGICGFPLTLLVTKIKPHILLPSIELLWGVMVLLVIACNTYKGVLVVRIIEGALEGACFPILHYLLGSWYNKKELAVRTGFFLGSGALGTMFGGYIQSGVYKSLNNKAGLPGWKWIFVIDFIITIPVAVAGYFLIPDTPFQARPSRFLSLEDIEYCKKRVSVTDKVATNNSNSWNIFKKLVTSWQFYVFSIFYSLGHLPRYASEFWSIVLKAEGYNVYQRNNYPTIQSAVEVLSCVLIGLYVDSRNAKWDGLLIIHIIWLIGIVILVKWDVSRAAQFVAYSFCGVSGAISSVVCSWANEMTREDTQLRAAVLGSFNFINIGPSTAFNILVFSTDYAPRYTKGTRISLGLELAGIVTIFVAVWFDRYQRRKRDYIEDQVVGKEESVNINESEK